MAVYGGMTSEVFDELANVRSMPFDGDDSHLLEVSDYLNFSMERSYNQLFQSIALDELATFEESAAIVLYEEGKLEDFKNKVIDWFKKVWAKIKKVYDDFMDRIDKTAKKFKKKMLDLLGGKDNAKEALEKFDNGKVYYRGYKFDKMGDDGLYSGKKNIVKMMGGLVKIKNDHEAALKTDDGVSPTEFRERMSKLYRQVSDILVGKSGSDASAADVKRKVLEDMLGSGSNHTYDGAWIKKNYSDMVNFVCDYGAIKRAVKRSYAEDKKAINEMIDAVKKSKKEAPTKLYTEYCRKFIALNNAVMTANLQVLGMKHSAYRNMVAKVAMARVRKPTATTKESANFGYTSQSDLVESLFAWQQ